MKSLLLIFLLSSVLGFANAADQAPSSSNAIKPGMKFADATKILSAAGLVGEEFHLDMSILRGSAVRYFPLSPNIAIQCTYTEASGQITHISLMISPSHRPVKGLDVYLPLRAIAFATDGSYTANFAPINPK